MIDFKKFVEQKHAPFMKVHVHWINLNEITNHMQKIQNFKILKERVVRQRIHFQTI